MERGGESESNSSSEDVVVEAPDETALLAEAYGSELREEADLSARVERLEATVRGVAHDLANLGTRMDEAIERLDSRLSFLDDHLVFRIGQRIDTLEDQTLQDLISSNEARREIQNRLAILALGVEANREIQSRLTILAQDVEYLMANRWPRTPPTAD